MKRVHVLVEGQTEEAFVGRSLRPHFEPLGLFLNPIVLSTKRVKAGGKFRGGVTRYEQVRRETHLLLRDSAVTAVTTMLDFYGLPDDFPGKASLPPRSCYERVAYLEGAFRNDIDDPRFLPYLSLHEFEALLLAAPEEIEQAVAVGPVAGSLADEVAGFPSPEEVNDGPDTHPAARIARYFPDYGKVRHGPIVAERIGLAAIRARCPHFDGWLRRLEALTRSA